MSSSIIYLDSNEAHAFQYHTAKGDQFWKKTKDAKLPESSFYEQLAEELGNTKELILVGPDAEKRSFRKWISVNKKQLGKALIAVLAMDQLTAGKAKFFQDKYFY